VALAVLAGLWASLARLAVDHAAVAASSNRAPAALSLSANPAQLVADGVSESDITAQVTVAGGGPAGVEAIVLFATDLGTLARPGGWVEAEDPAVQQVGEWGLFTSPTFGPFSGGGYLRATQDGAALVWTVDAPAVLVRYGQTLTAGALAVEVDRQDLGTVSTAGPERLWVDRVLAKDLGPGRHTLTVTVLAGEINVDLLAAGQTPVAGIARTRLRSAETVGSAHLSAMVRGGGAAQAAALVVPFVPGPPAQLVLAVGATQLPVGGVTTTVQAEVRDDRGRPVGDDTPVDLTTTLGQVTPARALTQGGRARAVLTSGTDLGMATLRAVAGGLAVTRTVMMVPGPPATVALTTTRTSLPANSAGTAELTVSVRDGWGHAVADGTPVALTSTLGVIEPRPAVTTAGGVARASLRSGHLAGPARVTATAGAVSAELTVTLEALDLRMVKRVEPPPPGVVVPGEVVTYTLSYQNVGAGTVFDLDVRDPLPTGVISPLLSTEGPRLQQIQGPPSYHWRVARLGVGERGLITLSVKVDTSLTWGNQNVITNRASVTSDSAAELTPEDNLAGADVTVVPGAAYTVTVRGPGPLAVGGATGPVTALVVDRYGNPVIDGTAVFFSTDLGSVQPAVAQTRAGFAAATFTTGKLAGAATVRVLSVENRGGFVRVPITPGPPSRLDLVSERDALTVGTAESSLITATLTDQYSNRVPGRTVTFERNHGEIWPTEGRTDASGQVTTTLRPGIRAVEAVVTARSEQLNTTITIPFVPGPVDRLDLVLDSALVPVGTRVAVTATVFDLYGNRVPNQWVELTSTIGRLREERVLTSARGEAVTSLFTLRPGSGVVRATVGAISATAGLSVDRARAFLPLAVKSRPRPAARAADAAEPTWTVNLIVPGYVVAGDAEAAVSAQVLGADGAAAPDGTPVTFLASLGLRFDPVTVPTQAGLATTALRVGTEAGIARLDASTGDSRGTVLLWVRPGPAARVAFLTSQPGRLLPGEQATITAHVRDRFGNPADGDAVRWHTQGGVVSPADTWVDRGIARTVLQAGRAAGTATVTVASGAAAGQIGVPIGPPVPAAGLLLPLALRPGPGAAVGGRGCRDLLANGSFETDADGDGQADTWSSPAGGSGLIEPAAPPDGRRAVRLSATAGRPAATLVQATTVPPGGAQAVLRMWTRSAAAGSTLRVAVWSEVDLGHGPVRTPVLVQRRGLELTDWAPWVLPLPVAPSGETTVELSARADEGQMSTIELDAVHFEACWQSVNASEK
jgi:uncharacterized repeat protein (TIGR01451 family)